MATNFGQKIVLGVNQYASLNIALILPNQKVLKSYVYL